MPVLVTKINLSATVAAGGGYTLLAEAAGDLSVLVTGEPLAPWLSGITDLNGDGIADITVGTPGSDDKDIDAGRIFVNFGSSVGGTTTTISDPITQITIDGWAAGDLAGAAVGSVSDLNGDGLAEILVGAPGSNIGGAADAGAGYVLWGNAAGGGIDLGDPLSGAGNGKGYVIKGEATGDAAGSFMTSIGDLNGDGRAEIIVGAIGNDTGGLDSGAAYVVWGKSTDSAVNLSSVAAGTGGFKIYGERSGDMVGSAVSVIGDQNGDGLSDIVIGAPGFSTASGNHEGAVYVVFGKATGTAVNLEDVATGVGGYRILGQFEQQIGAAVSAIGDVNGDGLGDILIGGQGSGGLNTGTPSSLYVVYGKSTTSEVLISDVAAGNGGFTITGQAGQDISGMSVAAGGDFNRDGIADFVIGTPLDTEGGEDAGAVYVVWGGGSGNVDLSLVAQGIGGAKIVGPSGSLTGSAIAASSDMNGDGAADLMIGSPGVGEAVRVLFAPLSWQTDYNIYGTNVADVLGAGYGGSRKIGTGDDIVLGLAGNDTITTGDGNDTLEGGTGADTMTGGIGNDTYLVDSTLDLTVEATGEGNDTVSASTNWTLAANIENLLLTGAARSGTGNELDNALTGTAFNDTLDGGLGSDTMTGGLGADTYHVNQLGDVIVEALNGGTDTVVTSIDLVLGSNLENLQLTGLARSGTGNELNNTITGTGFNDILDGGAGNDTMTGGLGDDTYYVNSLSDVTSEVLNGGTDTVIASLNWTLAANVETLQLAGGARIGTGNALANSLLGTAGDDTLNGGAGADTMAGGAGNDSYVVDSSADVISEVDGEGTDTVTATFNYTLGNNVESLVLSGAARQGTGNGGANSLTGTSGDDTLDGAGGADTMTGGLGDDTYVVDHVSDAIVEAALSGTDTVRTSIDFTLATNLENILLTSGGHTATGNSGDNAMTGSGGIDTLLGLEGNDTIDGGLGADIMTGGIGNDTYVVDDAGDIVNELAGEGDDLVIINQDWVMSENIENVRVTGTGHSATGNSGSNRVSGEGG